MNPSNRLSGSFTLSLENHLSTEEKTLADDIIKQATDEIINKLGYTTFTSELEAKGKNLSLFAIEYSLKEISKDKEIKSESIQKIKDILMGHFFKVKHIENKDQLLEHLQSLQDLQEKSVFAHLIVDHFALDLANNFDKLSLNKLAPDDLFSLLSSIAKKSYAANALIKKIESLESEKINLGELSLEKWLEIYKISIKQGEQTAVNLIKSFDKLGLDKASLDQRLELIELVIEKGEFSANAVAESFDKLGLSELDLEKRLELIKLIMEKGWVATGAVAESFDKLGLSELDLEKRLELIKLIIDKKDSVAGRVARSFDKLGLSELNLEKRLELIQLIIAKGGSAARAVAQSFDTLGLNKLNLEKRLELIQLIIDKGDFAASGLIESFDKLGVNELDLEKRLELIKLIIDEGDSAARTVLESFDKLGLSELGLEKRLGLIRLIIDRGESTASSVARSFDKLGLKELDLERRFELIKLIIGKGSQAAASIATSFNKLELEGLDLEKRVELSKLIINQGERSTMSLVYFFDELGLETASVEQFIGLIRSILQQTNAYESIINICLSSKLPKETSRQLLLHLSISPHFRETLSAPEFSSLSYKQEIEPLINLLNLQPPPLETSPEYSAYVDKLNTYLTDFQHFLEQHSKLVFIKALLKEGGNPYLTLQNAQYLAFAAGIFFDFDERQIQPIKDQQILSLIVNYQNSSNRYQLIRQLGYILQESNEAKASLQVSKAKLALSQPTQTQTNTKKVIAKNKSERKVDRRPWADLSWILLSRLVLIGMPEKDAHEFYNLINARNRFKDTKHTTTLLNFFLEVIDQGPFVKQEMNLLTQSITNILSDLGNKQRKSIDLIISDLQALTVILKIFGRKSFFQSLQENLYPQQGMQKKDYNTFFLENFQTLFTITGEIKNFTQAYQETFAEFRDPRALYTYLGTIKGLPQEEEIMVHEALSRYVSSVLRKDFTTIRYAAEGHPHLKKIYQSHSGIEASWIKAEKPALVERVKEGRGLTHEDYKKVFYNKIIQDKHLEPDQYPYLRAFLKGKSYDLEGLNQVVINQKGTPEEVNKAVYQQLVIQFLKGEKALESFLKEAEKVLKTLQGTEEHQNDLIALWPKQQQEMQYEICETDDPCDLILIGTEIQGSCQRIDGDPYLNKCLPGYFEGEVRPIVIKRKDNHSLVARSVIRLLWDDKNQTPILLQERIYSNRMENKGLEEAINNWAIRKAKEMNIPLVSKEVGAGDLYKGTVEFLGGRAPFVYTDAGGGVKNGQNSFIIEGCHLLYIPT
jgi:hypothetical protein